jgi:TonB family protein
MIIKVLLLLFLPVACIAQNSTHTFEYQPDRERNDNILHYSEQVPEPPCNLKDFFAKNLRYPKDALQQQAEGRVYIEFIVTETGYLDSIKLKKGLLQSMNEEALRLIKLLPQPWQPGKNLQNQPAKFWYVVPVIFKLE